MSQARALKLLLLAVLLFGGVWPLTKDALNHATPLWFAASRAALAAVALMPIAALSLLYGVLYLNTAAAALATFATLILMRLLVVFPETIQRILLTSHFGIYVQQGDIGQPLILLLIYTLGFGLMAIYAFDRRDV